MSIGVVVTKIMTFFPTGRNSLSAYKRTAHPSIRSIEFVDTGGRVGLVSIDH